MPQKTAIIACRVSTKKGAQEGESLDTQEGIGRGIAERLGANVVRVWHETFSGRAESRDTVKEILAFVRASAVPVHYLIFRDIDRLTRAGSPVYRQLKDELAGLGVTLVDSYGLIQPSVNTLAHLSIEYPWSVYSPSEMAETMKADYAKDEARTILTRLIGTEIQVRRQGYQIGSPHDGFVNQRISVDGKRRFIEAPDRERAEFFVTMFELRAAGNVSDPEIVTRLNALGFRTKRFQKWDEQGSRVIGTTGGHPLSVKRLHAIIRQVAYCGVICERWTDHRPIRAKYPGLVSIDTFNRANRGKVFLREGQDGGLAVLYDQAAERTVRGYQREHPLFPYKPVLCPRCRRPFLGSCPRGSTGRGFPTYHCARGHSYLGIAKGTFDGTVENLLNEARLTPEYAATLERFLVGVYRKRKAEVVREEERMRSHARDLAARKEQLLVALIATQSAVVRQDLERKVEQLEAQRAQAEGQAGAGAQDIGEPEIRAFVAMARSTMEPLQEPLLDKAKTTRMRVVLSLIFEEIPTYEELRNGTAKMCFVFDKKWRDAVLKGGVVDRVDLRWNYIAKIIRRWREEMAKLPLPSCHNPPGESPSLPDSLACGRN